MSRPSNPYLNLPIRQQLSLLILAILGITLIISMLSTALVEWQRHHAQVRQSLITTARSVGIAASAAIVFGDRHASREALLILGAQQEISAAALYTLDGALLADYGVVAKLPANTGQLVVREPEL